MATIEQNFDLWNNAYKWPEGGDEWSKAWGGADMQWHGTIWPRIHKYFPTGRILEIAPGFGRWTQFLIKNCDSLHGVDLSQKCIESCQIRFDNELNVSFKQNDGKDLSNIENNSIDLVFSFDSLVHAEKEVIQSYVSQIKNILKEDGVGIIHHSNLGNWLKHRRKEDFAHHWRAESMTYQLFEQMLRNNDLQCISQEIFNWGNQPEYLIDCITIFTKSSKKINQTLIENGNFMLEAELVKNISHAYCAF